MENHIGVGCLVTRIEKKKFIIYSSILLVFKMAGRGPRRAPGEYINLPSNAAADVDAYFEYRAYEIKN